MGYFLKSGIDFYSFDNVLFTDFEEDVRNEKREEADLYKLIASFKSQIGYNVAPETTNSSNFQNENKLKSLTPKRANINVSALETYMASLREIKSKEELVLLTKAIRISAVGQIETMKAMHPGMSEAEKIGRAHV